MAATSLECGVLGGVYSYRFIHFKDCRKENDVGEKMIGWEYDVEKKMMWKKKMM